jgi:hypothetical protein
MTAKRKQRVESEWDKKERDPFWCQWRSRSHGGCHRLAERGLPFCGYHCAAAFGMARGASSPDEKTRALFEEVYDYYEED